MVKCASAGCTWKKFASSALTSGMSSPSCQMHVVPSLLTRRILPFSTFGFCAFAVFPASPIVTQSLPSGPNRIRQPS